MNNAQRKTEIEKHLRTTLQPTELNVIDESHLHIGHTGAKSGMGHFAVEIKAPIFQGKTKIQQHQMIYQALDKLMQTEIHALRITVL